MKRKLVAALVLLVLSIAAVLYAQGSNILEEGFEGDTGLWSLPEQAKIDRTVSKSGECSLKIELGTDMKTWASAGRALPVEPGVSYRIRLWSKLENCTQTHCKINWLDSEERLLQTTFVYTGINGTRDWFETSVQPQAPENSALAQLVFLAGWPENESEPARSWFDDISVSKIKPVVRVDQDQWARLVSEKYGADGIAPEITDRVIYFDKRHDSAWVDNIDSLLFFFNNRGFTTKNADALKSWMQQRIAQGSDKSVCILAMGIIPDTIAESMDENCTLRRYLDSGGRVVWIGDIPLFYRSYTTKLPNIWGMDDRDPRAAVLGISMGGSNLVDKSTQLCDIGRHWGMEVADSPVRTFARNDMTLVFSEVVGTSFVSSFFKNYNPDFPYSGFIRYRDGQYDGANQAVNKDLYRLATYIGKPVEVPVVDIQEPKPAVKIVALEPVMMNYRRGQDIQFKVTTKSPAPGDKIKIRLLEGNNIVKTASYSPAATQLYSLSTKGLASREYKLEATLYKGTKLVASDSTRVSLFPTKTQKLYMGMYAVNGGSSEYKANIVLSDLKEHLGEVGVITGGGGYLHDQALKYGLHLMPVSGAYYDSMVAKNQSPELQMRVLGGNLPTYHYGGMGAAPVCMGNPINRATIAKAFQKEIRLAMRYPAFIRRMYVSDDAGMFGDPEQKRLACYCDYCTGRFKDLTGYDAPAAPAEDILKNKGIVADKDPWYLWMKFRSRDTYGGWNESMEKAKNELDPKIKFGPEHSGGWDPVFNPQWALNPPDDYGSLGMVSFYYYPQLYRPAIALLPQTALGIMGNRDKELWVTPQSSDYANLINDQDKHARLVTNEFYVLLCAGAKGITWFEYCNMPGTKAWEAMKPLSSIAAEYGPMLTKLKRKTAPVCVLASYANASYQWAAGSPGVDTYKALLNAHVPVDYISDEEILAGELGRHKVLAVSNIDFLTRSVYDAISAFASKGNLVLIDSDSEIKMPFAVQVSGAELVKKAASAAGKLRIEATGVVVTEFSSGAGKYCMLVNTDTVKPSTAKLNLASGNQAVYDVFARKAIGNGELTIPAAQGKLLAVYPGPIAAVSIVVPSKTRRGSALKVSISIKDKRSKVIQALIPVRLDIIDPTGKVSEYSDYFAAENGKLSVSFTPASNDLPGVWKLVATELSSGKISTVSFRIE